MKQKAKRDLTSEDCKVLCQKMKQIISDFVVISDIIGKTSQKDSNVFRRCVALEKKIEMLWISVHDISSDNGLICK